MLEAVWAIALSYSQGFKKLWPSVLFFSTLALSMLGLSLAMSEIPIGTAYSVWVGIGAALTIVWGFITKQQRPSIARISLIVLLLGSVIGLKVVS